MVASDGPGQMMADLMCWFVFDVDSGWIEKSFSSDAKGTCTRIRIRRALLDVVCESP